MGWLFSPGKEHTPHVAVFEFYSSRHFPRHLRAALRLLAMIRKEPHWKIHNRALARGLKSLWQEAELGPWPGREKLETGELDPTQLGKPADDKASHD